MYGFGARVTKLEEEVKELKNKATLNESRGLTQFERALHLQQGRLVDLEDRSRRSNLIVFGGPDIAEESEEALRTTVIKELFQE